jgi:hypothetical protein
VAGNGSRYGSIRGPARGARRFEGNTGTSDRARKGFERYEWERKNVEGHGTLDRFDMERPIVTDPNVQCPKKK